MALLAEDGRFGVQAMKSMVEIEAADKAALDMLGKAQSPSVVCALVVERRLLNVHVEGLRHIPIASLVGGTLCLLVSVVLFAVVS
jgi:hypothetical protein